MSEYVAFLRGINIANHKMIKMEDLRKAFEELGFQGVKTILVSGNILFSAQEKNVGALAETIRKKLAKTFGYDIEVMIRTVEQVRALADSDPFEGVAVTPLTRLYVTFLPEKAPTGLKAPYRSPEGDFQVLRVSKSEVCSTLVLSPKRGTTDLMNFIEKNVCQNVTTRSWNTIVKILKK